MLRESGGMPPGMGPGPGLFGAPPPNANPSAAPPTAGSNPSTNAPFNPSLWPPFPQPGQTTGAGAPTAGVPTPAGGVGAGTGAVDPALIQQILGGLGAGAGGGGLPGFGGAGGFGATPPQPADSRPPEERFQVQLQVRCLLFAG